MKFLDYLKDHLFEITVFLFFILFLFLILSLINVAITLNIFLVFLISLCFSICLFKNFYQRKKFYNNFQTVLKSLDQKYLISEMITESNFLEGKLLLEYLYEINKSMKEKIGSEEEKFKELKDYIELWIHEIKLPISSLILRNHNKNLEDKKELEQIKRIENDVEQVLYYVRSEHAENDYYIHKCSLKEIIKQIALRNKDDLLNSKIDLEIKNIDYSIQTDSKWLEFILNQIISNSIKYCDKSDSKIVIEAYKNDSKTFLTIEDNGMGIKEGDLPKVFNKSFTGINGRNKASSTGMGLYLCKKMCQLLGHKITIESKENEYTKITIIFGNNSLYEILK